MESLKLAKHKQEFLESIGFEKVYDPEEPNVYNGVRYTMEKWSKFTTYNAYHLFIHFDESESNYCNLYYGQDDDNADVFSERNLVSEIKKRCI